MTDTIPSPQIQATALQGILDDFNRDPLRPVQRGDFVKDRHGRQLAPDGRLVMFLRYVDQAGTLLSTQPRPGMTLSEHDDCELAYMVDDVMHLVAHPSLQLVRYDPLASSGNGEAP